MIRRWKSLSLSLAAFLVSLIVLDGLARPLMPPSAWSVYRHPAQPLVYRYAPNSRADNLTVGDNGWYIPDSMREWRRVVLTIDRYGYRNPASDPAQVTLIALGDSYGVGAVSDGEEWPRLLVALREETTYNLSVASVSPWQEYAIWLIESRRLDLVPHGTLVWMLFTGNDLDEFYYDAYTYQALPQPTPAQQAGLALDQYIRLSPLLRLTARLRGGPAPVIPPARPDILFYSPYLESTSQTAEAVREHPNYPRLLRTIQAMQQDIAARGWRLAMVLAPSKEEIYGWALQSREPQWNSAPGGLSIALSDAGVCFLDLKATFTHEAERVYPALLWWGDDTHWNPAGNQAAAEAIADWLATDACPEATP
jgi:lysophospholipase L1-like esterase